MTVIFGTLKDVGGQLAQGTVTVSSLVTRPAHGAAETVITKELHVLPLRNGAFESPELDPGPVRVEATTGGAFESWEITLPEDGRHDLATLTESQHVYEPPVVGAAQAAAQEAAGAADRAVSARVAAESARDGAVAAADRVEGAADAVSADAAAAADAADRAEVAADAADASATAAAGSADEAGAAAERAESSAAAAAASESAAEDSAASAAGSATEAGAHADRAEGVVDSVSWDDDRLTVAGKTSPSLRGPRGEPGGVRGFAIEGEGTDPVASGGSSLAAGWESEASGRFSTALGHGAKAAGDRATALGRGAKAEESGSTAVGYWATAKHQNSSAVGSQAITTAENQIRIGTTSSGYHVSLAGDVRLTNAPSRDDNATTKAYVDGAVAEAKALAETRPAFFSGKGAPPATIPGAVVGDYYLDESTMELHKITGV